MKKLLLLVGVASLPLATASMAYAVPATGTQPSDYSQDVTAGQKEHANDQTAKNQAGEVDAAENVEGQVDDGDVTVDEAVGEQEDNMGENEGGESVHGDADVTESSNDDQEGASTSPGDTNDSISSDGETN